MISASGSEQVETIWITVSRESGSEAFDYPGFRVTLAIASLPGMTIEYDM